MQGLGQSSSPQTQANMRTTIRTLLAVTALASASALPAQVIFSGAGYTDNSASSINSLNSLSGTYGTSTTDATYWLSLAGYRSDTVARGNYDSSAYSFNVSLSYVASGTSTVDLIGVGGYRSSYFKGTTSGSTAASNTNQNFWAVSYRPDGSPSYSGIRTNTSAVSPNGTKDYILLKLDYNTANLSDSISLWFVDRATFSTLSTTHNYSGLGNASYTVSGIDLSAFNTVRYYSGTTARTVGVSDVLLYQQIPEPSTYALLFGAATLGFAGYRRFRKRQA